MGVLLLAIGIAWGASALVVACCIVSGRQAARELEEALADDPVRQAERHLRSVESPPFDREREEW